MATDRLVTILALLAQRERTGPHHGTLCSVAAEITEVTGASIVLASSTPQFTALCSSNEVARELMDLEITLGEGPCGDACRSNDAVNVANLNSIVNSRWLAYAPLAVAAGALAVFSFPVGFGAVRLGALTLYRDRAEMLSEVQASDAYLMASVIGRAVLAMQAGTTHGALAADLEREGSFDFAVHQAAGMVAVQGSMSVRDALVALRSHAFSTNCQLLGLSQRVVTRETSFDAASGAWRHGTGRKF